MEAARPGRLQKTSRSYLLVHVKLKGEEVGAEKQSEALPPYRLGVAFPSCLQHQRQTWTRDRCCITGAQRGRWGRVKAGQGTRRVSLLSPEMSCSYAGRDKENAARSQNVPHAPPVTALNGSDSARSSPAAWLRPLLSVRGVLEDVAWQGRSAQSGCRYLGSLTLVQAQICRHTRTKGQGS